MKRYFSSFFITSLLYIGLGITIFYQTNLVKKVTINNEKTLSLNHISLVQQKKVIKKVEKKRVEKKKPPKKVKKRIKKPKRIVKKIRKIKKVKTIPTKVKKTAVLKKEKPKPVPQIEEIKEVKEEKLEQEKLVKTAIKKDYKKEFIENHLHQIIVLIQKSITYPKRAKRFNVQGKVLIEFTIRTDGKIENFEAIQGHRLLKKSAIQAIIKASKAFPKVNEQLRLRVPIVYSLT